MKLLQKLGIPAMALAGVLTLFTPSPANARVRVGVTVGRPVYGYVYVGPRHHHWHRYHHYYWR